MFYLCHHVSLVLQWFSSCSLLLACGWEKQKVSVDVIEKEICALDLVELAQETLADVASSRLSHGSFDFFSQRLIFKHLFFVSFFTPCKETDGCLVSLSCSFFLANNQETRLDVVRVRLRSLGKS